MRPSGRRRPDAPGHACLMAVLPTRARRSGPGCSWCGGTGPGCSGGSPRRARTGQPALPPARSGPGRSGPGPDAGLGLVGDPVGAPHLDQDESGRSDASFLSRRPAGCRREPPAPAGRARWRGSRPSAVQPPGLLQDPLETPSGASRHPLHGNGHPLQLRTHRPERVWGRPPASAGWIHHAILLVQQGSQQATAPGLVAVLPGQGLSCLQGF